MSSDAYLIIANSTSTHREHELARDRTIVALDGAADYLQPLNLAPNVLLGDFDSIQDPTYWGIRATYAELEENAPSYQGNHGVIIHPCKNQQETDLAKGIAWCDQQGATEIVITNASDGRLDHTLYNLRLLRRFYRSDRSLLLFTATERVEFVRDSRVALTGPVGSNCAVMAFPQATITTQGLCYEVDEFSLDFANHESVCNSIRHPNGYLDVQGEALLIQQIPHV